MKRIKALEHYPEIAEEIGHLMGHYAALEYHMFITFAAIATSHFDDPNSDHIEECFAAFYELRSVNLKSELALKIAEGRLDEWRLLAWKRLWRRFKGAASRRTDVAHCVFMGNKTSGLMRLKASGKEPTFEPLDMKFFERTNHQFHTLGRDISTFLPFVVGTQDRIESLLRALPLPINIPFPQKDEAPPAPLSSREKSERRDSVYRLGLAPLWYED
jgi:hypothetical protein